MADDTYIFQLVSITSQSVSKLVRKRMHLLRRGWLDVSKLKNKLILQGAIDILRTLACPIESTNVIYENHSLNVPSS